MLSKEALNTNFKVFLSDSSRKSNPGLPTTEENGSNLWSRAGWNGETLINPS